jgi:hypothetical protein
VTDPDVPPPLLSPVQYEAVLREANAVVEVDVTFPEWVFTARRGSLRYTDVNNRGWFALRDFAELHGDDPLSLVVLDPSDHERIAGPDLRLAFTLPTRSSRDEYYRALHYKTDPDYVSDIQSLGARIAVFGPSKRWAIVAERDIAAWWSDLPPEDSRVTAFERRRRPWAYTVDQALNVWGLQFRGLTVPEGLAQKFREKYESFDRLSDPEQGLPEWQTWDFKDEA